MTLGISRLTEEAALTRNVRLASHLERLLETFPGVGSSSNRSSKATLLVATEHRGDVVSVTLLGYPAPEGAPGLPFLSEATQAFATAGELAYALQLGRSGEALHRRPTSALVLEHVAPHPPPQRLDGASFGGAFFLTEFARLAGLEIPGSVVVLAQVEQAGQLAPVSDFSEKVGMLLRHAPSVRNIYVALHQSIEPELRAAAENTNVRFVALRTVADLAATVFQASIVSGLNQAQRVALIDRLFFASVGPVSHQVVWAAKRTLAEQLAAAPLEGQTSAKLTFVRAVANRRERGQDGSQLAGAESLLSELPRELALLVAAHVVQEAAIFPDIEGADELCGEAAALLAGARTLLDCSPSELKLRGALARRELLYGSPAVAFETNLALAQAWFAIRPDEASYPISQLFRCASIAPEEAQRGGWMKQAEATVVAWRSAGGWNRSGDDFIRLESVRAALLLGMPVDTRALIDLVNDTHRMPTVRIAAAFFVAVARGIEGGRQQDPLAHLKQSSLLSESEFAEKTAAKRLWVSLCAARPTVASEPDEVALSPGLRSWLDAFPSRSLRWRLTAAPWGW
jgi:hypothetical protein